MTEPGERTRKTREQWSKSLDVISVWVIEDDQAYRDTLVAALNASDDVRCEHAFSECEEALKILANDPPPVVLMDIGLPKGRMNGIEGTERVKSISPSTDVIMLTIHGDDENVFKAIVAGASGYMLKGPEQGFEVIGSAIREVVLGGGSPMSPYIARRVLEMFSRTIKPKEKLFRAFYTIDTHLKNIYAKLHVHKQSEAVAKWLSGRPSR
jgi:DNA-binding NarL/FixJ family response regulator